MNDQLEQAQAREDQAKAKRLKRTQLTVLAVMAGLGWDQMDNATRAAAIAMQIENCQGFITATEEPAK